MLSLLHKTISAYIIVLSVMTPNRDGYVISIPRVIEIDENGTISIGITHNNLDANSSLDITFPQTFTLSDSHGKADISGTISNPLISFDHNDYNSKTVSYSIASVPVGDWSGQISMNITLHRDEPSNVMKSGSEINSILQTINPTSITFTNDIQNSDAYADISTAQDNSVLLYVSGNAVTISNNANTPIIGNEDMSGMFMGLTNLTYVNNPNLLDTSSCIDMSGMFSNCLRLKTLALDSWNVSSCESFESMFEGCIALTSVGSLDNWLTSNVNDMSKMFKSCAKLRRLGDISAWNTSSVNNMSSMFEGCKKITDIGNVSGWDVSVVESFASMFKGTTSFTGFSYLGSWNVSNNCTDLSGMFAQCEDALPSQFDIHNWNVSNVENMSYMFSECYSLSELVINGWNTSNLINTEGMFMCDSAYDTSSLTSVSGISSIDTSSLENISYMFYKNSSFNEDLSGWVTGNITDMSYAFYGNWALDLDKLKHWNISSVQNMTDAFGDSAGVLSNTTPPDWYH
ncbi:MAG: BspA family leucine-rich repeat surface protein [Erysipelotrichaceae bacterium]|nr:BspA family leucine-rich repeat surface protein [Erysipelotrichaceae bacterium]